MKIDWKRKLTSRKFWMALASFVSMMVVALGGSENDAKEIAALIMAGAAVVAYIIGEGLADMGNAWIDDDMIYINTEKEDMYDPEADDGK